MTQSQSNPPHYQEVTPGPEVIKLFHAQLSQLSITFILLINVKMPTIVGILTFMSMKNAASESLKARKVFNLQHLKFLCEVEIPCSVELSMKNVL